MKIDFFSFDDFLRLGEDATHPLARPVKRLALSLLVAGTCLLPRRFAPATRPSALSGASN